MPRTSSERTMTTSSPAKATAAVMVRSGHTWGNVFIGAGAPQARRFTRQPTCRFDAMKILEVAVEGIRGIPAGGEGVDLNFQSEQDGVPNWIVIAGRNGAGKSTLLRAIALAIAGPAAARNLVESFSNWIHDGETLASTTVKVEFSPSDSFKTGRPMLFNPSMALQWSKAEDGPAPVMERKIVGGRWDPTRGPWSENPRGWFVAGYGPFRRLSSATSEALRLMMSPGRPAALASLFREDASLSESIQWLQSVYLKRLEGDVQSSELEKLVLRLLADGLLPEGMVVERVDSSGLWVTTPDKRSVALTELSDGYRTVTGLVLDLVRQVFVENDRAIPTDGDDDRVVITQDGVVLIDEIDVHLHVSWQRRIGFWLKEHFPNIQFIVTTHSPFICQAVDPGGLVRLSPPWEDGPAAEIVEGETFNRVVNGSTDDALLTDLFGLDTTISDRANNARARIAALEARAVLGELDGTGLEELRHLQASAPTSSRAIADVARRGNP